MVHDTYRKTVPTIGTAGMYVLDKGIYCMENRIVLPGPEGMRLIGTHCTYIHTFWSTRSHDIEIIKSSV